MFNPVNNVCVTCGNVVQKDAAQQLVMREEVWRRQHQECFDTEKRQRERRQFEVQDKVPTNDPTP